MLKGALTRVGIDVCSTSAFTLKDIIYEWRMRERERVGSLKEVRGNGKGKGKTRRRVSK